MAWGIWTAGTKTSLGLAGRIPGRSLRLAAGYTEGEMRASDNDCDKEDDDPGGGNVEDVGEPEENLDG